MKILFIDVNCENSSTGKIVYDLYTECKKEGHEAAICFGRGNKINEWNIYKFGIDAETCFHALMTRLTGLTGCYSFFSTCRLLSFMERFKPDVVHIHELHAYFVNIAPVVGYLKKNKIKTIWTFHCEFMYTGKCGYAFECGGWKKECGKCPHVKEYPSSLFFDFTRKMFKEKKMMFDGFDSLTIAVPSRWLADRVQQSFLGKRNIRIIHNGIDTKDVFHTRHFDHLRAKHNIKDEKIVLAVALNIMSNAKGGRYVLELAKRMKEKNVKFVLIGIENLKEKFDDNVIALGRMEDQIELAQYYSMADLFVICSKKETFSMTCAESLSCGTPVVGFMAGAPETIALKEYSEFVEYGDVDRLLEAVYKWLNNKNHVSHDLSEIAGKKYSKGSMYESYVELYKE